MTAWMLIANWRHTRRRMHTQNALVAETTSAAPWKTRC
jgi:hypothetical protein